MDILGLLGTTVLTIWTGAAAILRFVFNLPVVGPVVEVGFYVAVAWALYRYTPPPIRRLVSAVWGKVRPLLAPLFGRATRGLRRLLWGDRPTRVVYREVKVTRSFRSNVMLRLRWSLFGAGMLALAQNWSTVGPYVMPWITGW